MKKNFLIKVLFIFLLFPNFSMSNDLTLGKEVAETICAACHGVDGRAVSGGNSALVPNIFAQNKDYLVVKLKEYKSGKEKLYGFFVGEIMKASSGKANPKLVNDILKEKLKK